MTLATGLERRHLVIVHEPGWSDLDDWRVIARHIAERAPDLRTYIVNNADENALMRQVAARAPTLVVSPGALRRFQPLRGRVYAGRRVPKIEQLQRLAAAGLPVPRTAVLAPGQIFDKAGWGRHVIVKPADGMMSTGVGIRLHRTEALQGAPVTELAPGNRSSSGRVLVQTFIDTGPSLDFTRVLTLFGRALYCMRETLRAPMPLDDDGVPRSDVPITNQGYTRAERVFSFIDDPDLLNLAARCYAALPEHPLQGVDLLRERGTGRLYVLELNPGGNTWHFSSSHSRAKGIDPAFEAAKRDHFNAFSVAADVLIERTRAEAV